MIKLEIIFIKNNPLRSLLDTKIYSTTTINTTVNRRTTTNKDKEKRKGKKKKASRSGNHTQVRVQEFYWIVVTCAVVFAVI